MDENKKTKKDDLLLWLLLRYFDKMHIHSSEKIYRATIAEYLTLEIYNVLKKFKVDKGNIYGFRRSMTRTFIDWILYSRMLNEANLGDYKIVLKENYGIDLDSKEVFVPVEDIHLDSKGLEADSIIPIINKLEDVANEIVDSTLRNIDDDEFFSIKRAERIARDEANRFSNMINYEVAKQQGYKYHVWHTMDDEKVRGSHDGSNNQKKLIYEPFSIGGSLMMYPMDDSLGADIKEIIGCRCSISYE